MSTKGEVCLIVVSRSQMAKVHSMFWFEVKATIISPAALTNSWKTIYINKKELKLHPRDITFLLNNER